MTLFPGFLNSPTHGHPVTKKLLSLFRAQNFRFSWQPFFSTVKPGVFPLRSLTLPWQSIGF